MNIVNNSKNTSLRNNFLFILIFAGMAISYYDSMLTKGPLSEHQWRQTDCLSFAYNYSQGAALTSPEMLLQNGDGLTTGKTVGEFPILYYIVGKIWSITGESFLVFRLLYLLILTSAILSVFNALQLIFKDFIWSTALSLLLFTSPIFVFYGVSFLTDVPALCFVLIGSSILVKYHFQPSKFLFFLAMFFFTLGGILKSTSLIAFVFIGCIFLLELIGLKSLKQKKIFNHSAYQFLGFAGVLVGIVGWYYTAVQYNNTHHFHFTSNSIHPFWISSTSNLIKVFDRSREYISYLFFSRPLLYSFFALGIFNLFLFKRIPIFLYLANLIILLGTFMYILLWAPLFGIHDYYYTPLLIWLFCTFIPFAWFLKSNFPKLFKSVYTKLVLSLFLIFNFFYCLNIVKIKSLGKKVDIVRNAPEGFYSLQTWYMWENEQWRRYEDMKPYLLKLGIKPSYKVISLPDFSFNLSLYMMKHKGWTNFNNYKTSEEIELLRKKGAKYLFIEKRELLSERYLQPFISNQIGDFKGILIFKL